MILFGLVYQSKTNPNLYFQTSILIYLHKVINDLNSGFYNGSIPLPNYPRPQFRRTNSIFINLNGFWDYKIIKKFEDEETTVLKGQILVPFPPESALSGVKHVLQPNEYLIYSKTIEIDSNSPLSKLYEIDSEKKNFLHSKSRLFLNLDTCDYYANIYINHKNCFKGEIGYVPTSVEITDLLQFGQNKITIIVRDQTDSGLQPQTLWLESTPKDYLSEVKITPNLTTNSVSLRYKFVEAGSSSEPKEIKISVFDKNDHSKVIFSINKKLNKNEIENEIQLNFGDVILDTWSPENPNLYDFEIKIGQDEVITCFGMREFGIKNINGHKQLTLNGKPYFMSGLLDQGYWPESNLSPPSEDAMIFDIMFAKNSGFNMIRKHIKVEPSLFYYHCDRLGLIVWQDVVNSGMPHKPRFYVPINDSTETGYEMLHRSNKQFRIQFEKFVIDSIGSLYNVVSIGLWTLFNEGWGQFDSIRLAKLISEKVDNSRPIDSTSGFYDQGENTGQFLSLHIYYKKIEIDQPPTDKRCLILSEFGGYSYKTEDSHQFCPMASFGYKVFDSISSLQEGFASLYRDEVMSAIEKGLCATVYTQLTDVESEINGLLTYDRKIQKLSPEFLRGINSELYEKYKKFVDE